MTVAGSERQTLWAQALAHGRDADAYEAARIAAAAQAAIAAIERLDDPRDKMYLDLGESWSFRISPTSPSGSDSNCSYKVLN